MKAVILAGGKGSRLEPYTTILPKPLMPLGDVPILDIIIRQLKFHGFAEIIMAVGYLAELLMSYFGDGGRYDLKISYAKEETPLGTAGPLTQIPELDQTFLVMNGDILTTLPYIKLVEYHKERRATATIAMHKRIVKIEMGVMETNEVHEVAAYIEKPTLLYQVSMGVYVFEPRVRDYIPVGERMDFPELVQVLLRHGEKVVAYPYDGYWLDIGSPEDYRRAMSEFEVMRSSLLKG